MSPSQMTITEQDAGDVTVLGLAGEMTLDDGELAFRRRIHELIERGRVKIVVDLGEVSYMDSSGVGMIAAKLKTVRESGGDIRLVHLTRRSERLLKTLRLLGAFHTFEDRDEAVRSFE
jgi:anti-sigma B factor antagonist